MATLRIQGDTSGYVDLTAPDSGPSVVLTLPAATSVIVGGVGAITNGVVAIGNTVSGVYDNTTIAQTAPVIVTNGKGTITLSHASSGVVAGSYGNAAYLPAITTDAFGHVTAASPTLIQIQSNNVLSTLTNDTPVANTLGEYNSAVSPTGGNSSIAATTTYNNLCSILLGSGDWEVSGTVELKTGATTAGTRLNAGISKTSNAIDDAAKGGYIEHAVTFVVSQAYCYSTGPRRISISTPTTIQLVGSLTFTVLGGATWGANSFIQAWRTR